MSRLRRHLYRRLFSTPFMESLAERTDFWTHQAEPRDDDPVQYRVVERDEGFAVCPETQPDDGKEIAGFEHASWALLTAATHGAARCHHRLFPRKSWSVCRTLLDAHGCDVLRARNPTGWMSDDEDIDLEAAEIAAYILRSPHRLANFLDAAAADVLRAAVEILKDRHAFPDEDEEPRIVGRYRLEVVCEQEDDSDEPLPELKRVSQQAAWLKERIPKTLHEIGGGLYLDFLYRPIGYSLYTGTMTNTVLEPRQIFAPALLLGAGAVSLWHTHGMMPAKPSDLDRRSTAYLREAGKNLGIPVLESIVIGEKGQVAFVR